MVRPNINKTDIHSIFNDISLSDVLSRILYGSTPVKITGIEFHVNMLTFMKLDNNSTPVILLIIEIMSGMIVPL